MSKPPLIQFTAVVFNHRGKNTLLIRKELSDERTMKYILNEIIKKGSYNFYGQVIFTNRFNALVTLRKKKII